MYLSKFLFSFGVIAVGLFSGFVLQVLVRREIIRLPMDMDRLRKLIMRTALFTFLPVTVIGAVWSIKINDPKLATLPFLGSFSLFLGGALALALSRMLRLSRAGAGSLFVCGFFVNLGAIGGLICYVFLGEAGFGFVPIYRLFEEFLYYMVGFPVARFFASEAREGETFMDRFRKTSFDPLILVSVFSITAGGALNLSGLARPEFYRTVNSVLIPLTTIVFLVPIGMAMKVGKVRHYLKESVLLSLIRFLVVPAVVSFLALLLGYGQFGEGLVLKVVIVLSSMPGAFMALSPPSVYDLDLDLANSCWLFSTGLLVLVLPWLYFVIQLF